MFENDNEHDFNLVIDMHTKLNDLGIRIRQRVELILDVEEQGYSPEVFETVKLLKDLQEIDNAKASFRKFKLVDVTFVLRVLPYKLGLKVSNLDLLGLIEDEELFGKLDDDDAVRVCLLLALEVIFIGKKLVDEVPDTLMRLVENLVVWNDFRWGEYIWRHLYDQIMNVVNKNKWEHLKGLSKSRNYVPTYTLSGFVWSFKIWILESFEGSLIWWNRDPEIIPRGLAWSRKQLFKRSDYSLLFGKVNLDLTPTISEQQTFWYMAFRKFYMSYIPRSPPTTYTDLFDDYMKKLSSSRKRGKIDTRDLPIIRRCDTTSVEEIRLKDGVIAKLNSRVFKLEAIIKVLGRERKGVSLEYLLQEESRLKQEEEERFRLEEHKMMKALFLKTLQEEVQRREEKEKMLKYEEEKKKRRHELMNSDHWKLSVSKISNGKRTQKSSAFSAYYWGNTFAKAEKDRPLNTINDQDMNLFLKDVTPWVEDLSRYNWATDRVHLTDVFDIFLELWVNYMWHFKPHDADWAMVGAYFVKLLLQDSIPSWYADGNLYKVSWCDVEQIIFIPEPLLVWLVAPFLVLLNQATIWFYHQTTMLLGFNMDEEPIIEVDDIGYQMDTTLQVYHRTQELFQNLGVEANSGSFFVGAFKESLILSDETDRSFHPCANIPEVMMQAKVFDQKGIDHTRYTISFTNDVNVPKQGGVFGDCGIWTCIFFYRLSHGLSLDVDNLIQTALAYREHMAEFFKHSVAMCYGKKYYVCPCLKPGTDDRGCGYFIWKDDFMKRISSSGPSTPPSLYTRPSRSPSYYAGTSRSAMNVGKDECSNFALCNKDTQPPVALYGHFTNDVKSKVIMKIRKNGYESPLEKENVEPFYSILERIRLRRSAIIRLGSQPDNPLVDHGRGLLERLTGANMQNAMQMMGARPRVAA
ncbi:hypothetical protein Tco_0287652 [Tanacetum coccineum]